MIGRQFTGDKSNQKKEVNRKDIVNSFVQAAISIFS